MVEMSGIFLGGFLPLSQLHSTPVVNFGEVRRAQLAKSTLLTSTTRPLGSFKICSDAKERVDCGKQREPTAPTHPSKTVTLVPEFVVEHLPLGRTAALVPEFTVKGLPLAENSDERSSLSTYSFISFIISIS